ncbi:ATPase, putative [Candida dubliniensis CD36]|uniref:ATPase, putative n=1 Tax=Candida dubliniensis (strain CD36 / ATCC MYA-646 / CBS 7987 / NCPF 3949 / NRRL Y-17841) TaxID=573826 RepID=B9W8R1_CANDC|nr:ATPase, putative [Candida dubliniensis CD36]CAX45134.1 ATPase, putative [Candida dubliniensis CD36]
MIRVVAKTVIRINTQWKFYCTVSGGVQGVEGRVPRVTQKSESTTSSLTITDPYLIYLGYIQQGILEKDESQLRVMKEFQKLYHRVLDYTPPEELQIQLSLILRQIEVNQAKQTDRNNKFSPMRLFKQDPELKRKQLVRYITDEEELQNFASPQGLLINGEVGCGKSMLMDIFAASLPHKSKMRWHYNNFILWVFSEMHKIQQQRMLQVGSQKYTMENEFLLYEVAQKMVQKNSILMLDEFVLPDIASANIIKILFTFFFKLGGVLVATSNKLPEELYSTDFSKRKFKDFVGILNMRCQSIDMKSEKDYRTYFANESSKISYLVTKKDNPENDKHWLKLLKVEALGIPPDSPLLDSRVSLEDLGDGPSSVTVYGRVTNIPLSFNNHSVCYLDFKDICQGLYSSSDYITIASTFKCIVLDNVPVMTTKMKNDARRFITLLDAIYESRCQFFMRSDIDIDYLFFPDVLHSDNKELMDYVKSVQHKSGNENIMEVQDEEMFARTSIDMNNPYRPNISTYDQSYTKSFDDFKTVQKENINNEYVNTRAFTGDDEKFAFKRAVSRVKEMVASESWRLDDRWVPLDHTMRPWESPTVESNNKAKNVDDLATEGNQKLDKLLEEKGIKSITLEIAETLPREYSLGQGVSFRLLNSRIAPIFDSLQHYWAMGKWSPENGKRLKDSIARSWIRSSIRKK